ncbi:MAG: polyprenyl synthetase family protein [Deltaproteobacteria bacterium]|nr:MAG: polyprenyl synthetase family protein [Deltaproteobacteria bacterium]
MNVLLATPDFLTEFERAIAQALDDPRHREQGPEILLRAARYVSLGTSAKRLRPLLVDHFGQAVGLDPQRRLAIAVCAELVHTASLLHDDVVDAGTERRGRPTVNAQWSNSVAVLGGDLVLCLGLQQLEALPPSVTRAAIELVADMTRGAMLEVQARRARSWDLELWARVARAKTGALLAWCGTAPALTLDRSDLAADLAACGMHLGMAFQITDDLLDLTGGDPSKDPLADLRQANPSFPVALARATHPALCEATDGLWRDPSPDPAKVRELAEALRASGVLPATVVRVEDHLDRAMRALGAFRRREGGEHIARWAELLRGAARGALESA